MQWADVVALGLSLPGTEEGSAYGAPALRVGGKVLICQPSNPALREDGAVVVLHDVELEERAVLVEADPGIFFFTDHYRNYPAVLVRLRSLEPARLRPYLERSWRRRAPKRLLKGDTPAGAP